MNDVKSMKKGRTHANTKNCQCFSVRKNFILYVLLNCLRCWLGSFYNSDINIGSHNDKERPTYHYNDLINR